MEFTYLKKHSKYDEGQVIKVLQAAADRVEPICPHFGVCGGCSLQHLHPEKQIQYKQNILLEQLLHIGGITPKAVLPPLKSPTSGYRHKARLGVKFVIKKNKVLVGFHELNGRYLADIQSCAVLHPAIGQKISALSDLIAGLAAYQSIPQIEAAIGDAQVALIIRHLQPLAESDIDKIIEFANEHHLEIYLQPGGLNTVAKLYPKDTPSYLWYELAEQQLKMYFHPNDFTQINPSINRQMIQRAIEWLNPNSGETILDLFCGIGNFTLPLARYGHEVVGVEGNASAIQRARENSEFNAMNHVQFHVFDLSTDCKQQSWGQRSYDKILLDPPRTGALDLVKQVGSFHAKAILYISCNPATMARDAKILIEQGYSLTRVCVMDMFPHTSHVESMALFESPQNDKLGAKSG